VLFERRNMNRGKFTALVMAGSRGPSDPVAQYCGVSHKALAPIAGRPMIEHVLDAVAAAPSIGKIILVIEKPELLAALPTVQALGDRVALMEAKPSPSWSVTATLDQFDPYPALITTADHPLLTPAMIEEFVAKMPGDVDVAALVARDRVIQAEHPETKRTYLRFSDAAVSGCNLFALPTKRGRNAVAFWRRLERDRKKPWKMAWSLGPRTIVRFALRRLTVAKALDAVGRQADVRAALVESSFGTAAIDVDKAADHVLVERILRERAKSR
jgi:GTP:adenosylcobinamide-phosphate guanylyltransferase